MELKGGSIIAGQMQPTGADFYAINPADGQQLQPGFAEADEKLVDAAVTSAERDFDAYRLLPLAGRADFLLEIAKQLESGRSALIERAGLETGLPQPRLEGELTRTINQLKLFADFIRDGDFLQTCIDLALPDRQPLPRPDLRMTQIPLGPVAVFGASNFPFAFSVAGGDTAAALAAGCSVIVKGHPAHPGTCELAARAIAAAVEKCGLPPGVFSLLQGSSHQLGAQLVKHPLLQAVAFTGSQAGGRALFDLAAARPVPIPVYAEMGSVNPVFVLPQALLERGDELAAGYADSVALGVGQFCTKPGLMFVVDSPQLPEFVAAVEKRMEATAAAPMLHAGIKLNYRTAFARLVQHEGVQLGGGNPPADGDCAALPVLLQTTADRFLSDPLIAEEVFGPSSIVVVCDSFAQMQQCATALEGQLTATIQATEVEIEICRDLVAILQRKAGRLLFNGFPTGVEVCHSMVHGGPYPATTDSRSTSVGAEAIRRFLRPICLQNFPASLRPMELQD